MAERLFLVTAHHALHGLKFPYLPDTCCVGACFAVLNRLLDCLLTPKIKNTRVEFELQGQDRKSIYMLDPDTYFFSRMEPNKAKLCDRSTWSNREDDFAVVALKYIEGTPLGEHSKLLHLPEDIVRVNDLSSSSDERAVHIFGYPRKAKGQRVSTEGRLKREENDPQWQCRHTCETGGGFSGSAVLTLDEVCDCVRIVAVHWDRGKATSIEHVCRMTGLLPEF